MPQPQAQEGREAPEAGGRGRILPQSYRGPLPPETLISGVWAPEQQEDKFLLFGGSKAPGYWPRDTVVTPEGLEEVLSPAPSTGPGLSRCLPLSPHLPSLSVPLTPTRTHSMPHKDGSRSTSQSPVFPARVTASVAPYFLSASLHHLERTISRFSVMAKRRRVLKPSELPRQWKGWHRLGHYGESMCGCPTLARVMGSPACRVPLSRGCAMMVSLGPKQLCPPCVWPSAQRARLRDVSHMLFLLLVSCGML